MRKTETFSKLWKLLPSEVRWDHNEGLSLYIGIFREQSLKIFFSDTGQPGELENELKHPYVVFIQICEINMILKMVLEIPDYTKISFQITDRKHLINVYRNEVCDIWFEKGF